jgi:hypothetical protein
VAGLESSLLKPAAADPYPGLDLAIGKVADGFDFKRAPAQATGFRR